LHDSFRFSNPQPFTLTGFCRAITSFRKTTAASQGTFVDRYDDRNSNFLFGMHEFNRIEGTEITSSHQAFHPRIISFPSMHFERGVPGVTENIQRSEIEYRDDSTFAAGSFELYTQTASTFVKNSPDYRQNGDDCNIRLITEMIAAIKCDFEDRLEQ
jgi:hypothetical protein